jgi:putative SOS response-associated peptidase YedK
MMCYDISFSISIELITDYLPELEMDPQTWIDFDNSIHVLAQAHRKYPVIIFEDGRYKLKHFEWGVIADYMDTPQKRKQRSGMCNARSEKILSDPKSFWRRIRSKRCLIPVTGVYEHRGIKGWKNKVPYYIKINGRNLFCIPGLYHYNKQMPSDAETGEMIGTFSLITRPANEVMKQIHNSGDQAFRMPMFLPAKEMELQWLKEKLSDEEIAEILNFELPSDQLEYWPVFSIRTTKPRPDNKAKIDPFEWANLPDLGSDEFINPKEKTLFG